MKVKRTLVRHRGVVLQVSNFDDLKQVVMNGPGFQGGWLA